MNSFIFGRIEVKFTSYSFTLPTEKLISKVLDFIIVSIISLVNGMGAIVTTCFIYRRIMSIASRIQMNTVIRLSLVPMSNIKFYLFSINQHFHRRC